MSYPAITCVVIFSFAIGVICGRIWQRYAERPVTGMAYGNRSPAEMQMAARGIPNAGISTPRAQVYPQGQQYRMGDWDKGQQE